MISAGAVNGIPAKLNVSTPGTLAISYATNGVPGTLSVQPRGTPHAPVGSGPDRVAIIGGSTAGRDHFPFPVASSAEDFFCKFGTTIEQTAWWFYVVKNWRVTGSVDWVALAYDEEANPTPLAFHYAFDIALSNVFPGLSMTRESDLVLLGGSLSTPRYNAVVSEFATINGLNCHLSFQLEMFGAGYVFPLASRAFWDSGTIRPSVYISGSASSPDDAPDWLNGGVNFNFDPGTGMSVSLDGVSAAGNCYDQSTDAPSTATVSITPREYWPYATKAGLPVYDTSTGAQIRDPLS